MTFTRQQLKTGFCGHLYAGHDFLGGLYIVNGKAYLMQVEYGKVISYTEEDRRSFRKAGREQWSESRAVQRWERTEPVAA